MKKYQTIISGHDMSFSGRNFVTGSEYYPEYKVEITESISTDIDFATSSALQASKEGILKRIPFKDLQSILDKAAEAFSFDEEDVEHCVRMMGMPKRWIENYISQIPIMMQGITRDVEDRFDIIDGAIGRSCSHGRVEIKEPIAGFEYAIVPGNDPRATTFVLLSSILGRIPVVLKVSKNEIPISRKVLKSVVDAGYPAEAINMLCWDTSNYDSAMSLHAKLARQASVIVPFGTDKTVDETLRYYKRVSIDLQKLRPYVGKKLNERDLEKILEVENEDLFTGRIFRHTTGNCATIVDEDYDLDKTAETIVYSAFHYPISCKAGKAVYLVGDNHRKERLITKVKEKAHKLVVGNPLDDKTDVGYVDQSSLERTLTNIRNLSRFEQVKVHQDIDNLSPYQTNPIILSTSDPSSPFLAKEISIYITTFINSESLDKAIELCNQGNEGNKRLSVSILTEKNLSPGYLFNINANLIHVNQPTSYLHGAIHQGVNYVEALTDTQSIKMREGK